MYSFGSGGSKKKIDGLLFVRDSLPALLPSFAKGICWPPPRDDEVKPSSNSSTYEATTLFSPFSLSRAVVSWVMLPTPTTQFPCPPNCCGKCLQVITLGKGGHGGSSKRSVGHSTHRKRWLNRCSKFAPVTTTRNPAGQKNISIGPSSIFLFCGKREKTKWSVFSGGGWGRGPRDNKQRALALSLVGGITQNKNSSGDDVQWLLLSLRIEEEEGWSKPEGTLSTGGGGGFLLVIMISPKREETFTMRFKTCSLDMVPRKKGGRNKKCFEMGLYFRKCVTLRSSIFPLFFEAKKPSCYPSFLKKISLPPKNTGNHPGFRPFFLFPPFFEILCLSVILGCGGQPKREVSCGERKVGFAFGRGLTRTWVGEGSRKPQTRPKYRVLPKKGRR